MSKRHPTIEQLLTDGLAIHRQGDLHGAVSLYRQALQINSDHAEALHLLGLALHQRGDIGDAIASIAAAVSQAPTVPDFQYNLAVLLHTAERYEDAADAYQTLLKNGHRNETTLNGYALALKAAGRVSEAEKIFLELVDAYPEFNGGAYNLGNLLMAQGRAREALKYLRAAYDADRQNIDIARNLATVYQMLGETTYGIDVLSSALGHSPADAGALNNLGNLYRQAGELDAARNALKQALAADPKLPDASYNLGTLLADINNTDAAIEHFNIALKHRPDFIKARWAALLCLPQIYSSHQQREDDRQRWLAGLHQIAIEVKENRNNPDFIEKAYDAISEITPFALPYLGGDTKHPMQKWGRLVSDITARTYQKVRPVEATTGNRRKRVVFVSAHLREHTISRLFMNWITGLDRSQFDIRILSTSGPGDQVTTDLSERVEEAYASSMSTTECVSALNDINPDITVYTDIGMDPKTQVLASLRLAPTQLMTWGHPVTSGFDTIDGFLSSEEMEPEDGESHYTEQLIRLPGLSICYERPSVPVGSLPSHDFLCAQSLFKVPPSQDIRFAQILSACPGSTLSFFAHPIPEVTAAFRARIANACASQGLAPDICLQFIPPCNRETFLRHLAGARVILDTFDWSGGNTSLESFAMGTPVVTLPGDFMRGRHTFAMLKMMGVSDLIANDPDDFCRIATELFASQKMNEDVSDHIRDRSDALFGDHSGTRALNRILGDL